MSLDPYATNIIAIKNALKVVLDSTTTFHEKVSFDYISNPKPDLNPYAHCAIMRDTMVGRGVKETEHNTQFQIDIVYICTPDEDELDKLIGYVGEVIDAIEVDRHMDAPSYVDNVEAGNVTFGFIEGDQALVRTARLNVSVRSMRNM